MFSKPFKVEGIISVTGTERSDLKERARDLFGIQDSSFDELCGDKNEMCVVKIKTFGEDDVTVYASENRPIFFEFNGKLIPTVCTLRVCTEMVPYFTTRPEVLSQLAQGADLMITEVVRQGSGLESWGNYSENDIVAVNLTSNQAAIGVGLLAHSSEDLCTGEDCGVCVVMLHVFGDELWEMEQSVCEQVPLLRETQSVRREEDIPILDESERVERINELDLSAAIEQPGDNENNSGNELEQSNQFNYDSLLKSAFLNTIILHRDKIELPIPMCTFYLQYVQPELPAAFEIEHSSYKLIGTFLEKMSEEGLIQIEGEEEDIQTIIAINSNHPNVQSLNGKTDNMNVTKFASVPIELYSCILKGPEIQNIDCQTTSVIEDGEPSTFPTCSKTIDSNLMKKSESDVNMEGFDERVTIDPGTSVKAVPGAKCSKAASECPAKEPSNSVAKVSKTQKKYHRKTVTDKGGNASRRFGYKKITSTKIPQENGLNVASVSDDVEQFQATTSTLDMNRKKNTKFPKRGNNLPTTSTSSKNTNDIPERNLQKNGMNVVNFSRTANQSAVNEPSVPRIKNEGWRHRRGVGNENITLKRNQPNKGMNETKLACAVNQGVANKSSTSDGSGTHDGGKRRKGYQNKNITHRRNPENNAVNVANLSSTVNQGAGYEPNTDVAKISGKQKAKNRSALRLQQFINKKCAVTEELENNGMAVTEYDSAAEQDAANAPSASVENVSRIRENYYQMALLEENTDGNELNASRFARDAQHGAVHSGITEVFKATSAIEENDVPTTATCSKYASFTQRKNPENNALNLINLSKTIHQDAGYEPNTNIAKVSRKQKAKIRSTLRLQQFINKKCAVTEESENNGVAVNKYNSVVEQDAANEPSASIENVLRTHEKYYQMASTNEGETGPKNNEKYYQKTSTRDDGKDSKRSINKNVTHRKNIENKDRNAVKFSNTNNQGASKKPSTNAAKVSTNQRIFYKTTATNSTLMKNKGITNVPGTCVANVFRTHKKGSQTTIANHNNHRRNPANNDVNMIRFSRAANRTPGNDANTSVAKKYRTQKKNNQTTSISKCEKGPTLTKKNSFTHRTNSQNNCVDIASIANALQQGTAHEPSTSAANVSGSQKSYWQATSDNNDNDPGTSSMYDELYYLIRDGLGGIEPLVWQRSPRLSETQSGNRAPGPVEEATELELSAGVDQLSDSQNEILKINSENGSEEGDQSYYDKLIKSVFLNVITIYNTRIQLPILFSTFYPKYMQPELSAKFDVKRSSHKKVGVFLNKMAGEGFIRIGEEKKGVQKIVAIHSNHPELRSFTPYDLKNPEPLHPNLLWTEMADMFAVYTVFGPKRVTIHLTIATRYRNKKITLISNLKEYGVNVNKFAKMVRLGAATSTSMKGEQLLVQGNHIKFVYNLLMETYEVPKSCITGLEFANDSEKKNYRRGVVSGLGFIQKRNKNRCRQTRTGYMAGEVREDTPISNSKYYRQTLTKFAAIDDREAAISAGTREKLGSKKSCCRIKSLCKGRKKTVIRSPAATRSEYRKVTLIRNPVNLDVNATNASNYFQRFSAVTISRIVVIRKRNNKGPKPSNNISITIESSKNAGKYFGVHVAISSTFADQGSTVEPSTSVAAITAPNVTTAEQQGRSVRNPSTNNRT